MEGSEGASLRRSSATSPLFIGEARISRLRADIAVIRKRITHRVPHADPAVERAAKAAANAAETMLTDAEAQLAMEKLSESWALFHEAEKTFAAADSEARLQARAVSLREEAGDKLGGWRQRAALRHLGDPGAATIEGVQAAMGVLNGHAANQYHKADLLASQILVIGFIALVILAVALWTSRFGIGPFAARSDMVGWGALLGALGGTLSAARSLTHRDKGTKIPDQVYSWPITLTRPIIGAAAGVAVVVLFLAGFVTPQAADPTLAPLSIAFLAGFSERYFLSLVGSGEKGGKD